MLVQRLKEIAQIFIQQNAAIASLNVDNYGQSLDGMKTALSRHPAENIGGLLKLIEQYDGLRKHLQRDLETLKQYGVK